MLIVRYFTTNWFASFKKKEVVIMIDDWPEVSKHRA